MDLVCILQGICFVGVTTKTTTRVVVVLGLFFRKKRVVVVFRGSGCSGFFPRIRPTGRIREIFRIWCSGFKLVVVVLNECEVEVRAPKSSKIRF